MPKTNTYDRQHRANVDYYQRLIDAIFEAATKEAAAIGSRVDFDPSRVFSFDDYPITQDLVKKLLSRLGSGMEAAIVDGVRSEWTLANNKNDELARRVFGDNIGRLTQEQYRRYFSNNDKAREAFLNRKEQGLNLSERVWRYADQFKSDIELGLDIGIRSGLDAPAMSRELQKFLQHPDMLFRRVRDEHGMLQLSKRASEFHPGQGVYRSSYKNARRLAATETNMAYHSADHERWQQLDFVVGIEIRLSGNHTCMGRDGKPHEFHDICDELQGRYPKDFKFTGWHPHCRCIATSILKTEKELMEENRAILRGEEPSQESANTVTDVPEGFKKWVGENKERILKAKSLPYFLKDNGIIENGEYQLKQFYPTGTITRNWIEQAISDGVKEISLSQIFGNEYDEEKGLTADYFGKNIVDWSKAETTTISTKNLRSVQDVVFPEIVKKYMSKGSSGNELIQVIRVGKTDYVFDGNHRAAAAILNGEKTIKVKIVKVSPEEFNRLLDISKNDPDRFIDIISGFEEYQPKKKRRGK